MIKKSLAVLLSLTMASSVAGLTGCGESSENNLSKTSSKGEAVKGSLTLTVPEGEAYPYIEIAQQYLKAPAGTDVNAYAGVYSDGVQAISLKWEYEGASVEGFTLTYSTKADYSDGITVELEGDAASYDLYNLYKGTKYYCKLVARGEEELLSEATFETTALGPRVMKVQNVCNLRDLGGYKTADGKTTKQGLLYRGSVLYGYLRAEGKEYMSKEMGIATELDLRDKSEAGNINESPIPDATLKYVTTDGYSSAFRLKENFRQVFSIMADKNNYPMYIHCTGGADRTGTVSYLLNALLGVSEEDLIHDFEFTTFCRYGERNSQSGTYGEYFKPFRETLETYEGETLQEKVENYMLSIGVTETEIANIRAIMTGEM